MKEPVSPLFLDGPLTPHENRLLTTPRPNRVQRTAEPRFIIAKIDRPAFWICRMPDAPFVSAVDPVPPTFAEQVALDVHTFRVSGAYGGDCRAAYDPIEHIVYTDSPRVAREAWRAGFFKQVST